MAGRVMKTIFDVIGRDSGGSATANKVASSMNNLTGSALRSKAALGGANLALKKTQMGMASAFKSMAVGGMFAKAGSGLLNFVDDTKAHAADLEFELATLNGIMGASEESMRSLSAAAQKAGIETQFTPTETVTGLQALAQQGFTTEQQLLSLNSVLMLAGASGGKVPLNEAAKLTTQTLRAFGLEAQDASISVDRLVKTTTMTGLGIDELAESMQNGASGAIAMGLGLEESLAAMGLIKNIIPSAAMAGSAFQILTQRLSMPLIQKKIKRALGLDVVDQATGKYNDFGDLLVNMSKKMEGMAEGKRGAFIVETFGARAQKGMASIFAQLKNGVTTSTGVVLKGKAAFDHYLGALDEDKVAGFAKQMNDMKLDTLNGQMQLLSGSLQTFQIELGKGAAAISKSTIKGTLVVFNAFLELFSKLPKPVKTAISSFLLLSGTILKLVGGFFIMKGVMVLLGLSFGGLLLTIGKILLLAVPLVATFTGLGIGIFGVFRFLSKGFGSAGESAASMFAKIKLGYRGVVDLISTGKLSEAVIKEMSLAKNKGVADFIGSFGEWWGKARQFFQGVIRGFDEGLQHLIGPWNILKDTINETFGSWFESANKGGLSLDRWQRKGETFGIILSGFSRTILEMTIGAVNFGKRVAEWSKDITMEDVVNGFTSIANAIKDIVAGVRWLIDNNPFSFFKDTVSLAKNYDALLGASMVDTVQAGSEGKLNTGISADKLIRSQFQATRLSRKLPGGIDSSQYGREGYVQEALQGRAQRLENLDKTGLLRGFGDGFYYKMQNMLVNVAQRSAELKVEGKGKKAKDELAGFDQILIKLENELARLANLQGKEQNVILKIGEEEFGRIVVQADKSRREETFNEDDLYVNQTIQTE